MRDYVSEKESWESHHRSKERYELLLDVRETTEDQAISSFLQRLEDSAGIRLTSIPEFGDIIDRRSYFRYKHRFFWYRREDLLEVNYGMDEEHFRPPPEWLSINKGCIETAQALYTHKDDPRAKAEILLKACLFECVGSNKSSMKIPEYFGNLHHALSVMDLHIGSGYVDYHHAMTNVLPEQFDPDIYRIPDRYAFQIFEMFSVHVASCLAGWIPTLIRGEDVTDDMMEKWRATQMLYREEGQKEYKKQQKEREREWEEEKT